ncbi:hypothetical protein CF392_14030 [Tamilnaduibacter salinus]|uniref:Response regulatory domain-containing protein n=1 Tax=Tamilnaduibacter salinus TaxID=1484056 RepID=A0A2A2I0C1_9GAMM|nr:response regulator [Tamilnaduibacter salinus]PAV24858.1 hypothetical protein CF392_14030 [Tamilnaduibacter salinus]
MSTLQKVAYVEDDPDIREIASLALEDVGGFTLKTCDSGVVAFREIPAIEPQLVLLDVMMPGMDGTETLAALREQGAITEVTLVVFMTAKVHPEEFELRDAHAADSHGQSEETGWCVRQIIKYRVRLDRGNP